MNNFNVIREGKKIVKSGIQIKKVTFILNILAFIILNFFLAFFINTQGITQKIEREYFFTADFQGNVAEIDKEKTEVEVLKLEGVRQVRYISKEEAFQKLQYQLDVAIPRGENPLSDSLIIYFEKPSDIEKIQTNLENNQNIKEVFVDGEFINYKERQLKFYRMIMVGIFAGCILPILGIVYYIFYSAISIDYINNIEIGRDTNSSKVRARKVNLLPFTASSIIGTLIFFNVYSYFRKNLLLISSKYLLLGLKEIFVIQVVIIFIINLLIWLKPIKIGVLKWIEDGKK
ncbi:permease-like cell division protein FtsX [Fusobacterium sp.]|uniref:cell division protein FtsX n=1 Tax=Fusobacterium sp. TaxID=68766 RepID=UPI0025C238F5|nr:permease-like cell division protein FtsX [Fusobacterium sp.]